VTENGEDERHRCERDETLNHLSTLPPSPALHHKQWRFRALNGAAL
jgi:hypothetical protein